MLIVSCNFPCNQPRLFRHLCTLNEGPLGFARIVLSKLYYSILKRSILFFSYILVKKMLGRRIKFTLVILATAQ